MLEKRFVVTGKKPELAWLQALGALNIEFAAKEKFDIILVEAQGEGTLVVALGHGGARATVVVEGIRPIGLSFDRPDPASIATVALSSKAERGYARFQTAWRARFSGAFPTRQEMSEQILPAPVMVAFQTFVRNPSKEYS